METNEKCSKCGRDNFAIARDMKSTRLCSCGHSWLPGYKAVDVAKTEPVKNKGLTDWEAGNELVAICDEIAQHGADLKESHPHIFKVLQHCRTSIANEFNKLNAHGFGL